MGSKQPPQKETANHPLNIVRSQVAAFDPADLLITAAALQLLPENADCLIRIEAFSHAIASLPHTPGLPRISIPRVRNLLNSPPLSEEIARAEDPLPNPFVEEVPFFGGSYRVFPGLTNGAAYVMKALASALLRNDGLSGTFLEDACIRIRALLALSDAVAKNANLTRGTSASSARAVTVPPADRLLRLKRAVTFPNTQVIPLLQSHGLPPNALDPFILPFGQISIDDFSFGDGPEPLLKAPIISDGSTLVVSIPEAILIAATHYVISLAAKRGETNLLGNLYKEAVFHSMLVSLRYSGSELLNYKIKTALTIAGCKEALFSIDSDKLMYVLLMVDTLDAYEADKISGTWHTPGLDAQIAARFHDVEAEIYSQTPAPNELLCLLVYEGVGRVHVMAFEEEPTMVSEFLQMTAHDLETIALLEGSNHLALWRFAVKSNLIRKAAKVLSWSTLDEFGLYRKNKYSYYLSDEEPYSLISVGLDFSAPLKTEVLRTHDRHTAPYWRKGQFVEVCSVHLTNKIPLYQPFPPSGRRIEVYVEGYPIPIWVIGALHSRGTPIHALYYEFCTTIGYWLWQVAPSLAAILGRAASSLSLLTVMVRLPADPNFANAAGVDDAGAPISVRPELVESTVFIDLKPGISRLLDTSDNAGERTLLTKILLGISQLSPELSHSLTEARINAIVDKSAPLGPKKMLLMLDVARNPELDPRSIPPYRPIRTGEMDDVLDVVGHHFTKTMAMPVGPVPKDKRNEILNQAVTILYKRLEKLVGTLDPKGLLEWLVAEHEAVVREDALRRLTIPTRLACFGSDLEVVHNLQKELPVISQTALASRFLIEYVVARPPSGLRRISDGFNDQLRGLAYEIITFGMHSDSVYYELSDLQLSILPSGRLGVADDQYKSALEAHLGDYTTTQIATASRRFARSWERPARSPDRESPNIEKIDAACVAEFGFPMTAVVEFVGALHRLGYEIDPGVVVASLEQVVKRASEALSWDEGKARQILDFLSLNERADFLLAPAGMKRESVYPWRFSRTLSYLRRPLLLRRQGAGTEVIWGNRHLESSGKNFVSVVMGGKFHPTSPEMKLLMGEMRNREGKEFNAKVAKLFKGRRRTVVREKVKAIGKLDLANLGDIDVLAADLGRRVLYVVECKDLAMARTPYELSTEIRELILGTEGKKSAVEKHSARVNFVRLHLKETIEWLGANPVSSWKLSPMVVVDEPLMSARIQDCPFPVISIDLLSEKLH
jgi:hypothetical protein